MQAVSLREDRLAALSPRYQPARHVLLPTAFGALVVVGCAFLLKDLRLIELCTVPAVFLFANACEWHLHRDALHKRLQFMPSLYDRHTPIHHCIYTREDMELRDWRELAFILIPPWAGMVLCAALLPIACALALALSPNAALLFLATCMAYVVSYELLHMSYHFPQRSFVGKNPLIRALARHHSVHHDPRNMQMYNMNVTLPLWDIVRGTRLPFAAPTSHCAPKPADAPVIR